MDSLVARAETVIDAPPERVWQALTDPQLIRQYLAGVVVRTDWRPGARITYSGEWNGITFEDKGSVVDVQPPTLLRTTHYSALSGLPDTPESYQIVTYRLAGADGGTRLSVTQENNQDEGMVAGFEKTWTTTLEAIKRLVENRR